MSSSYKIIRDFVRRHRRALIIGTSAVGVGYILHRIFQDYHAKLMIQEKKKEPHVVRLHEAEERSKAQLQGHFQNIQRISDSTALPSFFPLLKASLFEQVDLTGLTEKLMLAKVDPLALSSQEKVQIWQRLKVLSFTRTVCAMWAVTLLTLFVRVQLNILGRHVYMDTARDMSTSKPKDSHKLISRSCQCRYLSLAEFLPQLGVYFLVVDVQRAVNSVLQRKSLKEICTLPDLQEIFRSICDTLKDGQAHWLQYLLPNDNSLPDEITIDSDQPSRVKAASQDADDAKLHELMVETRAILSSNEFGEVLALSLEAVLKGVVEEFYAIYDGITTTSLPLAKLLPRVANVGAILLDYSIENKFVHIIGSQQQVRSFCGMVYASAMRS